jgi:UPF0755 protein
MLISENNKPLHREIMKKIRVTILEIISVMAGMSIIASLAATITLLAPVSSVVEWKEVEIPVGSSYTAGINRLKESGIIENSLPFLFLGKVSGSDKHLKPGFYQLSGSMSPLQIFNSLIEGRIIQYSVTIPEGVTLEVIKNKLEDKGLINDEFWHLAYDRDFLSSLDIDAPSLEGYIYPDTYSFSKGTEIRVIFRIMVQRMREELDDQLLARAAELGMTENQLLTLASIIEKEAIYNIERPVISAVYHNRLKKNMKLQADPTVRYGVKKKWKRIRYSDLRKETPYNTYVIKGLPPGPIASPGIKSIKAALYPADADYLFFVSKNNGTHYFSRTGEEHVKAVALYQRNGNNKTKEQKEKIN